MATELYHPELKVTVVVADSAAPHMIREGGWKPAKPDTKSKKKETVDAES